MYKYNNKMLPQSFDNFFFINHQANHNYNPRNKDEYQFICIDWILSYTGPKIWDDLPEHIKCSKTLGKFEKKTYIAFYPMNIPVALSELKIDFWLFIRSKQITKCNLGVNDESFIVHAY